MTRKTGLNKSMASAVVISFSSSSDILCEPVRHDVDTVLSNASRQAIKPTTSNDDLLTNYMSEDKVSILHILLNRILSKYPGFMPFNSDEITTKSSIGDVRSDAYIHCNITCSPI